VRLVVPGIDLLERSDDFPESGPILVITDGECDQVRIRREHAFLIPKGRRLPFPPKGPVSECNELGSRSVEDSRKNGAD
jgi:hypothetical protein